MESQTQEVRTRRSDPVESFMAAASVKDYTITETIKGIFRTLTSETCIGGAHDALIHLRLKMDGVQVSPSGARTRRSELQDMGLIEKVGTIRILGRQHAQWGLTDLGLSVSTLIGKHKSIWPAVLEAMKGNADG